MEGFMKDKLCKAHKSERKVRKQTKQEVIDLQNAEMSALYNETVRLKDKLAEMSAHASDLGSQVCLYRDAYQKGRRINKKLIGVLKAIYEHDEAASKLPEQKL